MSDQPLNDDSDSLSDEERRLNAVLAPFLEAEQSGLPVDPRALIDAHPDLADALRAFFSDYNRLQGLAQPVREDFASQAQADTIDLAARSSLQPAPGGDRATGASNQSDPGLEAAPAGSVVPYFGDYVLLKELGRGGMGVVYKARQASLHRVVALKMLRAGVFASPDELQRFQSEAEAIALLDHPGIVPIHEVGEHQGQKYFSMNFIEGGNLAERIESFKDDPKAAATLLAEAAEAVHHAHIRGILHRDLKPANILLDPEGHPHVTDFGLAKRVEGDNEITASGAILGTPAYMSPEQAAGRRGTITTATDVYGLGTILYALLTGKAPFGGTSVMETLDQVRTQMPVAPSRMNRNVPRDLEIICLKCLEKDPRRRYGSAEALAGDLRRWLAGEPISARAVAAPERAWMWCKRKPLVAGLLAAVVVSTIGGSVGIAWNWREAIRQRDEANRSSETTRTINAFLIDDILGQADPQKNSRGNRKITVEEALDRAAISVSTAFNDRPLIEAALRHTIGSAYRSLTAYDKAEPHLKASYDIRLRILGPDHRETLSSKGELASIYWDQGRFDEAEPLFRQTLADRRRLLGLDDRDTVESMNNLALLASNRGRYDEAIALLREAYDRSRRASGPVSRYTLLTLANLGGLLRSQGKAAEAEPLIRESLADLEKTHGPRDPITLTVLDNYASVLQELGKQEESEQAFRRVIAARLDVLGADHVHTSISKGNLAFLLFQRGKVEEAVRLAEECLAVNRKLGGELHVNTLMIMTNLSQIYRAQGRTIEAEEVAREALRGARSELGDLNPLTMTAMNNEATLVQDLGRFDEAERLFREAFDGRRQVLSEVHPLTVTSLSNLAGLLLAKGAPEEVDALLRDRLSTLRKALKANEPSLIACMLTLGRARLRSGRYAEAEPLLREVHASGLTIIATNLLGECLFAQGRHAEAEPFLLQSTPVLLAALQRNPTRAAVVVRKLEKLYLAWGKPAEAEPWRLKALDLTFPADPFQTSSDNRGRVKP